MNHPECPPDDEYFSTITEDTRVKGIPDHCFLIWEEYDMIGWTPGYIDKLTGRNKINCANAAACYFFNRAYEHVDMGYTNQDIRTAMAWLEWGKSK